jgi:hypothetical protein
MLDMIIGIVLFGTLGLGIVAALGGLFYMAFNVFKDGGFSLGTIHILGWVLAVLGFWPGFVLNWSFMTYQETSISEGWAVVMATLTMLFTLCFGVAMIGLSVDWSADKEYAKRCEKIRNK